MTNAASSTVQVQALRPDQGIRYAMPDGEHIVKAGPAETGGAYEVFLVDAAPIPPIPPHTSPWTATLHLLSGRAVAHLTDRTLALTAGATVTFPAGTAYTLEVVGDAARFLAVTSGDGAGRFFADLAASAPAGQPLEQTMAAIVEVTRRHGVHVAG